MKLANEIMQIDRYLDRKRNASLHYRHMDQLLMMARNTFVGEVAFTSELSIFINFRAATYQWMLYALHEYHKDGKPKEPSVILIYNYDP